ncbi:MAG: flagellar biosynthesis anti-sigma factor FlgM [Dehalococcoidia bacterium]
MTEVRKSAGPPAARAVVYDIAQARARAASRTATAEAPDAAGFSDGARELARAREAAEMAPEVRSEKVKALKHQIENGQYKPDPREIARSLVERGF